jgi:hypothetical protein
MAHVTTSEPDRGSTATDRGALGADDADVTGFGVTSTLDAEVEPAVNALLIRADQAERDDGRRNGR